MEKLSFESATARSFATQIGLVYQRANRDYWRNAETNNVRLFTIST
jgi:hypothetical protein